MCSPHALATVPHVMAARDCDPCLLHPPRTHAHAQGASLWIQGSTLSIGLITSQNPFTPDDGTLDV